MGMLANNMEKHNVITPSFCATVLVFEQPELGAVLMSGSMDTNVVNRLQEKASAALTGRRLDYVVDLDAVTYISSTGLGFLMYLLKQKKEYVYLSNPGPAVLKPFSLFDIKHLFRYYQAVADLAKSPGLPEEVIAAIREQKEALRTMTPHRRGLEILADYLDNEEELQELQRMSPYLQDAEYVDSVTLPADEKYSGALYRFLKRAWGLVRKQGGPPVDDGTTELIAKELMNNAVRHGYQNQPGGKVMAGYYVSESGITITFTDHGRGYKQTARTDDELPSAGLEMLRKIFDELTVGQALVGPTEGLVLGKGTTVTMLMRFNSDERP